MVNFSNTYFQALGCVGSRADPGVQAAMHLVVGCHYFPPGLQILSKLKSITTL